MGTTKENYDVLIKQIVEKSYYSLKNKKIIVKEYNFKVFKGMAIWLLPGVRIIILNSEIKNKSQEFKIALLSHELAHLELFKKSGYIKYCFESLIYLFSKDYRSKVEWETDKYAIQKGYAKERFNYCKGRDKVRKKYGYMTSKDIKDYAISINKW